MNAWIASSGTFCRFDRVAAVALDPPGDVITVGALYSALGRDTDLAVLKFDGTTGAERWRQLIDGAEHGSDQAWAVTIDAEGNIVAAGQVQEAGGYAILVVKLAAADGSLLWKYKLVNPRVFDEPHAVAVDAAGDVIIGGSVGSQEDHPRMLVAKLRGTDGAELWRNVAPRAIDSWGSVATAVIADVSALFIGGHDDGFYGPLSVVSKLSADGQQVWKHGLGSGFVVSLTMLGQGDLVAGAEHAVARLRPTDGSEVWRIDPDDAIGSLAVDTNDDVVLGGRSHVLKLRGSDGQELWSDTVPTSIFHRFVATDRQGDVLVAGDSADGEIMKRDGATGSWRWSSLDQSDPVGVQATGLALTNAGDAVVVGVDPESLGGYTVVKLSGADGTLTAASCAGDCNFDRTVTVDELVLGVDMALGQSASCECPAFDRNRDGKVSVDELVGAVDGALNGCQ